MPRIYFHQQLANLKDNLVAMATLSQQALDFSVEAYLTGDMGLCSHVHEIEQMVNAAERSVDQMAYDLLATEQPMAVDLRFILSVIKITGDLERVGDQAANIAERAESMTQFASFAMPVDIRSMGERVGVMIRSAIKALIDADAKLAEQVLSMDSEIDGRNRAVQTELLDLMQRKPEVSDQALNAILVSRNLERAADHATNIAEDVIFWVRGSDVRHQMSLTEAE